MGGSYDWRSPSSRLVLTAVLDILAEDGYDGLTVGKIRDRAGPAGPALGHTPDLEQLVSVALETISLFEPPPPTGYLRGDLHALLRGWRGAHSREERVVTAVRSAAEWHPCLRSAVHHALDRPLIQTVGAVVARGAASGQVAEENIQTLCWVLRALTIDRLRSGPRSQVDLDRLIDFLLAGLTGPPRDPASAGPPPNPAATRS